MHTRMYGCNKSNTHFVTVSFAHLSWSYCTWDYWLDLVSLLLLLPFLSSKQFQCNTISKLNSMQWEILNMKKKNIFIAAESRQINNKVEMREFSIEMESVSKTYQIELNDVWKSRENRSNASENDNQFRIYWMFWPVDISEKR